MNQVKREDNVWLVLQGSIRQRFIRSQCLLGRSADFKKYNGANPEFQ
jgi:hypothetical protein